MRNIWKVAALAVVMVLGWQSAGVAACTRDDALLAQAALQTHLPSTKIKSVKCAPIDGLFEVITGKNVLYSNAAGDKVIVGSIFDLVTRQDLTAPAMAALHQMAMSRQVAWKDLPAGADIIWGEKGGRKVAVIADPNCPICRRLHHALLGMKGIEVHEYLWPIFPKTRAIADDVVCAKDPVAALLGAYRDKGPSGVRRPGCLGSRTLDAISAFVRRNGWTGTPVIIRGDGRVLPGFRSAEEFAAFVKG